MPARRALDSGMARACAPGPEAHAQPSPAHYTWRQAETAPGVTAAAAMNHGNASEP